MHRSQVILRMPIDSVLATLIGHDGKRSDVMLFVAGGEAIGTMLADDAPFVPLVDKGRVVVAARASFAAIGIARTDKAPDDDALPEVAQKVRVELLSGTVIEGTLRYVAEHGRERTSDHLNHAELHFELHDTSHTYFIVKKHVARVIEC